jgi:outer membrane protein assembly factor BamB
MRRALVGVVGVAFLVALAFLASDVAQGQGKKEIKGVPPGGPPGVNPPGTPPDLADKGRLLLPTDPKLKQKLKAVKDYIDSEDWKTVAENIQLLLDLPKDVFVQMPVKGADGKEVETLVGIRVEANRLLAGLPRDKPLVGLDVYKTVHGATAKTLLQQAIADGDKQKFADAAQRFLWTDAGGEAAERLATILLDRGDYTAAAQAFDRLIQRDGLEKVDALTLYKAALCFHKGNTKEDKENKDKVWKQLQAKAPDGFALGGQTVTLDEADKYLDRIRGNVNTSIHDWPMIGGSPSRSGQGVGGTAFMQRSWASQLFGASAGTNEAKQLTVDGANAAAKRLEAKGDAVIPAAVPVTATVIASGKQKSILVFRGYDGVHAVELKSGKIAWVSPSVWSLERMLGDGQKQQQVRQWVQQFHAKPGVLLENSTIGTMSADGNRVYYIDDLAVPPFQQMWNQWGGMPPPGMGGNFGQALQPGIDANKLQAVSIGSGKLLWELGGAKSGDDGPGNLKHDFRNTHFLGAPLCLGGKLYFLNEKNQEIRLFCFDTGKLPEKPQPKDLDDAVVWEQPLGTAKEKLLMDWGRRINATHIAYGEGILVCPTNAGVLLGVDLLTHSLVWAHTYNDTPVQPNPYDPYGGGFKGRPFPGGPGVPPGQVISSDWKAAPPIISDGKVVFTAPDGNDLKCLNLRNGAQVWGLKRGENDVYLGGVYAGRVVIVGKKDVRALSLDDARELWRVPTGMPSGRGVASDNVYYVPLKEAVFSDKEKGPGIFAIDIEKGKIIAQTRSRKDRDGKVEVPGNLVFFDGQVVSQNVTEVVAYPQLKVKLAQMDELLAKNENDPQGLFERGELRLDEGKLAGAVEDLHAALKNNPPAELKPRAEAKLFDAMTELLQRDFNNGEKYLDEYRKLCVVAPTTGDTEEAKRETQRRKANFLCLLAKGREEQGKLGEALASYLEFGSLPTAQDELLSVVAEPAVKARPDVWARGRIKALMEKADDTQRKPLEEVIAGQWTEVKSSGDIEKLRHFVNMFGDTAAIGKEGRLYLAERLMERQGRQDLIDAELQFHQLENDSDPAFAARGLDGLARLNTGKGFLEDAYDYYHKLKLRFADTPVRDGKTGAQLFDDLATDKRFLQYLDEPGAAVGKRNFKANEERDRQFPMKAEHMLYTYDPASDALPFLRRHRIAVNYNNNHFKLVDRRTGAEVWSEPIDGSFHYLLQAINSNPNATQRMGYQSVGHLVVVNLGMSVVGLDTVNHKVLWKKNLLGSQGPGGNPWIDPNGWVLELMFPDGTRMPIGQAGPVGAGYACVQTRDGLMALDPLTGKTLWTRADVPLRCRLFGDDQHIYLVELDNGNVATNTRAFRATDGASVPVANFAGLYQRRLRVSGRELLVAENLPTGGLNLRLYDVQTGKDLWSQGFPAGSVVLHTEEPDLAGAIGPDGKVTVVNLRQRKQVVGGIVDQAHMKNVQQAHLLADGQFFYIAFHVHNPNNPGVWSNLMPNTGLRAITVSGEVYAFDRKTSKIVWHNEVQNQQLVLEQWKDMPVLLFTSRFQPSLGGGPGMGRFNGFQVIGMEAYDKRTGKVIYRQPTSDRPQMSVNQYQQIYAINNDVRNNKIEMIAGNYKVTITQDGEASAVGGATDKGNVKPGGPSSGASGKGGSGGPQGAGQAADVPDLPVAPAPEIRIIKD